MVKKISESDIEAMRNEFFATKMSPEMRSTILTIATAFASESEEENAAVMMAWYLAQPENQDKIPELANDYLGYAPDGV